MAAVVWKTAVAVWEMIAVVQRIVAVVQRTVVVASKTVVLDCRTVFERIDQKTVAVAEQASVRRKTVVDQKIAVVAEAVDCQIDFETVVLS